MPTQQMRVCNSIIGRSPVPGGWTIRLRELAMLDLYLRAKQPLHLSTRAPYPTHIPPDTNHARYSMLIPLLLFYARECCKPILWLVSRGCWGNIEGVEQVAQLVMWRLQGNRQQLRRLMGSACVRSEIPSLWGGLGLLRGELIVFKRSFNFNSFVLTFRWAEWT